MLYSKAATVLLSALVAVTLAPSTSATEAAFDASALASLPGMGSSPPLLGFNIDGESVFANYVKARNDGQFFLLREIQFGYEKPSSPSVDRSSLHWCSNIEFTNVDSKNTTTGTDDVSMDHPVVGYTAHCVGAGIQNAWAEVEAAGGQVTHQAINSDEFVATYSLSAVYVPQTNIFEGNWHKNTDNAVRRFWDDGRPTSSALSWEVHDEGDTHPNADTSSHSNTGKVSWISADEAANLLGRNAADFTPDAFGAVYKEVWTIHAPHAETIESPEAEDGADDANSDADVAEEDAPGTEADAEGGGESSTAGETDDVVNSGSSGNGRRLSVAISSIFSSLQICRYITCLYI